MVPEEITRGGSSGGPDPSLPRIWKMRNKAGTTTRIRTTLVRRDLFESVFRMIHLAGPFETQFIIYPPAWQAATRRAGGNALEFPLAKMKNGAGTDPWPRQRKKAFCRMNPTSP